MANETEMLTHMGTDASKWAAEFVKRHGCDEGLMLGWFANAIEAGRAAGEAENASQAETIDQLRQAVEGAGVVFTDKSRLISDVETKAERLEAENASLREELRLDERGRARRLIVAQRDKFGFPPIEDHKIESLLDDLGFGEESGGSDT